MKGRYIPLRYKARTAALVAASVWYRVRGRPRLSAATTHDVAVHPFFGLDGDAARLSLRHEERERIRRDADDAARGRLQVVGLGAVDCGLPIDWFRDPISCEHFPTGLFDMSRNPAIDWKFRDEVNLHRHFYALGQACYLTGERRHATVALEHLTAWLDGNPPVSGRYWVSALQCAIRVAAWLWLLNLAARRGLLRQQEAAFLVEAIREHARFIERHAERTPHSYNHLVGEMAALAMVGVALPWLPEATRWRQQSLTVLAEEAARQFSSEGGHREQSLGYHVFVLEAYTQVVVLCLDAGFPVEPIVTQTLERMYDFVLRVMRPDGMLPAIGDEGLHWHRLSRQPLRDARRLLSTGAALFDRADMKWAAGAFSDESAWLLGGAGRSRYDALEATPPQPPCNALADTGLVVWRRGWAPADPFLLFDVGPQGVGPAGHGHADALSFELCAGGTPLIADAGTFTYNMHGLGAWRRYFRGTSAHNTIRIDECDQALSGNDPFFWKAPAHARLRGHASTSWLSFADAEHHGYERLPQPVVHRRLLFWVAREYWLIWDVLTGAGSHRYESFLHFPDAPVRVDAHDLSCVTGVSAGGLRIVPLQQGGLHARVARGESEPLLGWSSPEYGRKAMTPTLVYSASGALPANLAILLAPANDGASSLRLERVGIALDGEPLGIDESGCLRVVHGEGTDYLLWCDHSGEKSAGDLATDATVALLRLDGETVARGVCLGGQELRWRGAPVPLMDESRALEGDRR